jgi:hypothetical protein
VTKRLSEGAEKRSSHDKGPAPLPPILTAKTEEPCALETGDSGFSSSPDRKLVTELSESLFRPEPSSVQSKSGKQPPSSSQQESSSPVLPAAASPIVSPSINSESSREERGDDEYKVTDKVGLSATKTCVRGDNYVAAVDKLTPSVALVTTISDDKPDEVASSASGDVTVFSGIFFYFVYLLYFVNPSGNYFK